MLKTNKKVLLINPKAFEGQKPTKDMAFFPYSIVFIVHYLKKHNICDADYYDLVMDSEEALMEQLEENQYDMVGLTALAANRFICMDLAEKIKERFPATRICLGGQFFGYFPQETLENLPAVDFVVRGEGEITTTELVQAMDAGTDLAEVKGLSFRRGDEIIHNERRRPEARFEKFFVDLDRIVKPGYDILQPMINMEDDDTKRAYPILVSKGCINNCVYCVNQNEIFRGMSLDFLLDEVVKAKERYKTRYFLFTDPSFGSRPKFVRRLCEALIERKIDIEWYCETRPDIPLDLLDLMREAGCISLHFAAESGSEKTMELMRRNVSLQQVIEFAKRCDELGITYGYFTLISFPDETLAEAWDSIALLEKLAAYKGFSGMGPLFIVPNTDLETFAKERGALPEDFDWFDRSYRCEFSYVTDPVTRTMPHYLEHLTEEQIQRILGFVLALQDFVRKRPRVRKLRYRFLRTYWIVFSSFYKAIPWSTPAKKFDVIRLASKMFYWFWLWKLKKPYYDHMEKRAGS